MSNIAVIGKNTGFQVSNISKGIISALNTLKVSEITQNQLNIKLAELLNNIQIITGQGGKLNEEDSELLIRLTSSMILERYRMLRIDEIPIIFNRGAIGEYGDVIGITVNTFNSWIKGYLKIDRKNALEEQKKLIKEYKPMPISEEEKKENRLFMYQDSLFNNLDSIKKGKWEIKNPVYLLDNLRKFGLINYSIDEMKVIAEEADIIYSEKLKLPTNDMYSKRANTLALKVFLAGNTDKFTLISNRKEIALKIWVEKNIKEGIDIEKLITDKLNQL